MKNKRSVYKQSNLINDENKNLSKRAKIDSSHISDSIEISKVLKNKPRPNNIHTIYENMNKDSCNVGFLNMPTLKDLERMFDITDNISEIAKNDIQCEVATSIIETLNIPTIDLVNLPPQDQRNKPSLSPSNIKIYENVCDLLSPTALPNVITVNDPTQINSADVKFSQTDWNTLSDEAQQNKLDPKSLKINELNTDKSNNNKTVDNNLSPNSTFSPLPSTSTDNITIDKNDELFHNSLIEAKEYKNTMTDKLDINKNTIIKTEEKYDNYNNYNDDDCVIVEDDTEPITRFKYNNTPEKNNLQLQSKSPKPSDVIVIDSNSVDHNVKTDSTTTMDDEIIDVDALIASNQSILRTFEKSHANKKYYTNVVDVSLIPDKLENVPKKHSQTQTITSKDNEIHTQTNNQQACNTSTSNVNSYTSHDLNKQIEFEVKSFFERFYNNRDLKTSPGQCSQLIDKTSRKKNRKEDQSSKQTDIIVISDIGTDKSNNRNNIHSIDTTVSNSQKTHCLAMQIRTGTPNNLSVNFNPLFPAIDLHSRPHIATENATRRQTNDEEIIFVSESVPNNSRNNHNNVECASPKISSPPKTKKARRMSNTESSKNLGNCPICIDSLLGKTIVSTVCGHVFCKQCLETAIKTNKKCPTCRKQIKNNGYHKIFL